MEILDDHLLAVEARSSGLRMTLWAAVGAIAVGVAGAGIATSVYFNKAAEEATQVAIGRSSARYEYTIKEAIERQRELHDQLIRLEQRFSEVQMQVVRFDVSGIWTTSDDLDAALANAQRFCIEKGFKTGLPSPPHKNADSPALWCLR